MDRWRREDALDVYHYGEQCTRRLRYALMEDAAQYDDYPDFHQPALIFHGTQDDVVPPRNSEAFVASHPNARLELLDSGHDLLNVLERIAPPIVEFLTGEANGGRR
jgi:pimeloyl-ACP methyl ester carboxylesterase